MPRALSALTEQAISILQQFVESGGDHLFYRNWGGNQFSLQVDNLEPLVVTHPQFIQEDLDNLTAAGLLRTEFASDGHLIYYVTRESVRFLERRCRFKTWNRNRALDFAGRSWTRGQRDSLGGNKF